MGEDKSLLPFGSFETLTEFQYNKLQNIFEHVYISTKDPSKFAFDADFIIDRYDVYAPTAGFCSLFESLETESFFVLGVDMPFVDKKIIQKIIENDKSIYDATLAITSNGIESLCGVYHRSLENEFHKMLQSNNHKLRYLLKDVNTQLIPFEDEDKFLNLNEPHQYHKAKQIYDIINLKKQV
ncbi:MAG: molybdenum cofactor guanylyltransferase MobA [Epsilonproteobacteria bacterium]|nr:molybdenum cofactor guanylyltransferase MobA [Campylobacterota bacterium]